jgi:hypothetical protein
MGCIGHLTAIYLAGSGERQGQRVGQHCEILIAPAADADAAVEWRHTRHAHEHVLSNQRISTRLAKSPSPPQSMVTKLAAEGSGCKPLSRAIAPMTSRALAMRATASARYS